MNVPDPYRGLCARTYDLLAPPDAVGDVEFFRAVIQDGGEPALEVGCGTGRLLLRYVSEGLRVEGVDLSAEMLAICRTKARDQGLDITVHQAAMQSLDLGRPYATIFVPYFSFQLLVDDASVEAALRCFYEHLEPRGRLVVPLFFPLENDVGQTPAPRDQWRLRREHADADGSGVRCWELASYDMDAQVKHSTLRFDVVDAAGATTASEQQELGIRWYTQAQFSELLAAIGFVGVTVSSGHTSEPANAADTSFTYVAHRSADR